MFRVMKAAALGGSLLLPSVACAEEIVITQKGKAFSEREVTLKLGDSIMFLNDDETTHNVHSATEGNAFDLGAQPPGDQQSVTFDTLGEVKVRCAIHPRMRMTVKVEE